MIIAVDFDGILCENAFPEIGAPNYLMISFTQQLIDKGHEVILWTTRNGAELEAAIDWCVYYGLHFTKINEPAPSNEEEFRDKYPTQSRKIYADIYIDDHNIEYVMAKDYRDYNSDHRLMEYLEKGVRKWKTEEKQQS